MASDAASTRNPWPIRIALVIGATAASLLVAEAILERVTPPAESTDFLDAPPRGLEVPWVLRPGAVVTHEGHDSRIPATTVRINQQGFRADQEAAVPKPAGLTRVLVFGDSFVFGTGVEADQTFAARWQERLGAGFEVLNFGVPGYATLHAVELLAARGFDFDPDAVVVLLSDNDLWETGAQRPNTEGGRQSSAIERFARARLAGKTKAESGGNIAALGARLDRALTQLTTLCTAQRIGCRVQLFFDSPFEDILERHGVDPTPLMDPAYIRDLSALEIPGDGHPNANGHARLAQRLDQRLGAWVRSLAGGRSE